MNDQQLALQAIGEAELLLEEYLQPCPRHVVRLLDVEPERVAPLVGLVLVRRVVADPTPARPADQRLTYSLERDRDRVRRNGYRVVRLYYLRHGLCDCVQQGVLSRADAVHCLVVVIGHVRGWVHCSARRRHLLRLPR